MKTKKRKISRLVKATHEMQAVAKRHRLDPVELLAVLSRGVGQISLRIGMSEFETFKLVIEVRELAR